MPGYDDGRKNDQRQGRGNQSSSCYSFLSFPRFPNAVVLNKAGGARHQVFDIAFVWCGRLASENLTDPRPGQPTRSGLGNADAT
jgi:hypothetical protein